MTTKLNYATIPLLVLLLLALTFITGCESAKPTRADRDEVRAVMDVRQKAIQTKDIELYKQTLLPAYSDSGVSFDALVEVMQENFNRHETIEFTFQRSSVDMDMNSARMVGQISYKVAGAEKPVIVQERTIFRRIEGKWTISGGVKALLL